MIFSGARSSRFWRQAFRRGLAVLLPVALVVLAPAALASAAQATTLTVTTTADELTLNDGLCSLREAIAAVNAPGTATNCGTASNTSNTIVLPSGHYTLSIAPTGADDNSSGDLNVTGTTPLTVQGAGQSATVIDASGLGDRVLSIAAGANVTLQNFQISGGHAPDGAAGGECSWPGGPAGPGGSGANGGGIYNAGTLSLVGVGVAGNTAGTGGAGGFCSSKTSHAGPPGPGGGGGNGGAIYNTGALNVTNSAILNNNAGGGGLGGGSFTCGFGCLGTGGVGGGGGNGGGLSAVGGSLQVTNSTLAGNNAGGGGGGGTGRGGIGGGYGQHGGNGGNGGNGGAIAASGLTSTSLVRNGTVASNAAGAGGPGGAGTYGAAAGRGGAPGGGGGFADSTVLTLQNTIVASNNTNGAANCYPSSGVADGGHDLSYPDASCPGGNGDPLLQAPADNGGPTQTMALGPGSAAIDRVPTTGGGCPQTDQRGVPRPDIAGTPCDIGAFEFVGGQITGTVTDSRTGAQIVGICVRAYDSSGGVLASTQTDLSGDYTLSGLAAGSVEVEFSSGCGAGNYVSQPYKDPVAVTDGTSTSAIDAAMVGQAQISGTVTARATQAPLADICVQAYDASGGVAASSKTDSNGSYAIGALPTGSYRVGFVDCSHRGYLSQYYDDKPSLASADPIPLLTAITRSRVNAKLVNEGQITGLVTSRRTHAPIAGVCAKALDSSGNSVAAASTNTSGEYAVTGLKPHTYRVKFTSRCGSVTTYATQYYHHAATLASANPVKVTYRGTTSGVNAEMRR